MATYFLSQRRPPRCPQCGRPMTTITVRTARAPYVVALAGCQKCGITSNERATPDDAPSRARGETPRR